MNDEPEKKSLYDANDSANQSINGKTFEHSDDQTFQPDDNELEQGFDPINGTTEMPDSEVEPPTVNESSEEANVDSMPPEPATFTDTLDEPRDEADGSSTAEGSNDSVTPPEIIEDSKTDSERMPFHADSIHESIHAQDNAQVMTPEDGDMPQMETLDAPLFSNDTPSPTDEVLTTADESDAEPDTQTDRSFSDTAASSSAFIGGAAAPIKSGWWNKKRTTLVIVVVIFIALLAGGAAYAYKAVYQSPDKVLSDAVMNLVSAKTMTYSGTLTSGDAETKINVSFNGGVDGTTADANIDATLKSGSTTIEMPVSFVGQRDTFYFKLSNLKKLETLFLPFLTAGGANSSDQKQIDKLISSIDGQWYKVMPSDLNESGSSKQTNTCVSNVIDKIRTDKTTQNEIKSVYKKYPLFTVEKTLGSKDGSLGYQLDAATTQQANEFMQGLKDTSVYSALVKCDSSLKSLFNADTATPTAADTSKTTVDVWVSRWSHQITNVTMNDVSSHTNLTFVPKVGDGTSITIPSNAKSITDLKKQFMSFEQSMEAEQSAGATAEANRLQSLNDANVKAAQQNGGTTTSNVEAIVQ